MKPSIIIYRPADEINGSDTYYWLMLGKNVKFTDKAELATKFASDEEAETMLTEIKKRLGNDPIASELKIGQLLYAMPSVLANHAQK